MRRFGYIVIPLLVCLSGGNTLMTSVETSRFLEDLIQETAALQSNPLIRVVISEEDLEFKGLLYTSALIQVVHVSSFEKLNSNLNYQIYEVFDCLDSSGCLVNLIGQWTLSQGMKFLELDNTIWNRRTNLRGKPITVTSETSLPYSLVIHEPALATNNVDEILFGVYPDILRELQVILNFTLCFQHNKDSGKWGTLDHNGLWNGMVRMILEQEAEMAVSNFAMTLERSDVVDFSITFDSDVSKLFVQRPRRDQSWSLFLEVFDIWFWLSILLTAIVLVLAFKVTFLIKSNEDGAPFIMANVTLALLQKNLFIQPSGSTCRLLILVSCFWGFVTHASYNATLTSVLSVDRTLPKIEKLEDIQKQGLNLMVWSGSASEQYFSSSTMGTLEHDLYKNNLRPVVDLQSGLQMILSSDRNVYFGTRRAFLGIIFETDLKQMCNVISPSTSFKENSMGFIWKKRFPYSKVFNYHLRTMFQSGVIDQIFKRWMPDVIGQANCKEDEGLTIGYEQLGGIQQNYHLTTLYEIVDRGPWWMSSIDV
ncbi:hypothetical protein TCAL_01974 [Tigriopus californicus]|uniref:Ionotropic glutamate receptor L-glutamate and glycine-binding domain-containing protein n=1 Tax=Tigriopus californicus TaxID=6832 RepID=A0A553PNK2_TIGCA|nr:hypothetical protein TCAL_01974 [Tigriopus californicus]